ncbi:hypothetical protein [Empedobacter brevis]|uniref:hypothetical protein n=1 Tax=Empedobacter brevis TaxID=247 RepID=UPI0039AEC3D7
MKYFIFLLLLLSFKIGAQNRINTDFIEINLIDAFNYYTLEIVGDKLKDSTYHVKYSSNEFINKQKVTKIETIEISKAQMYSIQEKLLNIDNIAFKRKSEACLDGLSLSIVFFDNYFNHSVEQRYLCISKDDELFKAISAIYDLIPLKDKKYFSN